MATEKESKLFLKTIASSLHSEKDFHFRMTAGLSFPSISVLEYVKAHSSNELKSILTEFNSFDVNKKNLFVNALDYNVRNYNDPLKPSFSLHKLDREVWRIKKGLLNTNHSFKVGKSICQDTIIGFIRALKSDSIFVTKMNIDGEVRRVLVKNEIGIVDQLKFRRGFNHLILDLKTFDVYNFDSSTSKIKSSNQILSISNIKDLSKLNVESKFERYPISLRENKNFSLLKKEIKSYFKRYKERTSFEKRHNKKPPGIFSKIKKVIRKK